MKKCQIKLSIIIISYNVYKKLIRCLNIIKNNNYEIIVIDNNSSDGTQKKLSNSSFSKFIRQINNQNNVGFARAVNQGIKVANCELILLLNPDTIPNLNAIKYLESFMVKNSNEKIGFIGGRLLKPGNCGIHGTFVNKPNPMTALFDFTNLKKIFKNNRFTKEFYYLNDFILNKKVVYGLSGGFLMFKKSLINNIGYFDENYFMYLEDVDIGVRAREYGYVNYYLPKAKIIHESGSSSSQSKYNINVKAWRQSRRYYVKKHFNIIWKLIIITAFIFDDILTDIIHIIKKEPLV